MANRTTIAIGGNGASRGTRSPSQAARSTAIPANDGRVAALGRELWEVIQRQPDLEFGLGASKFEAPAERERAILVDRQTHLESSIPMLLAETAADALAQLVVAASLLNRLVDSYPDPNDRAELLNSDQAAALARHDHSEVRREARSLERTLYSIRRYLEASAHLDADHFGARFLMPRDDDPFELETQSRPRLNQLSL